MAHSGSALFSAPLVSVALLSLTLPRGFPGWRLAFLSGIPIGVAVLFMRRYIPESPRWLLTHHRRDEADSILAQIEQEITSDQSLSEQHPQGLFARQERYLPFRGCQLVDPYAA